MLILSGGVGSWQTSGNGRLQGGRIRQKVQYPGHRWWRDTERGPLRQGPGTGSIHRHDGITILAGTSEAPGQYYFQVSTYTCMCMCMQSIYSRLFLVGKHCEVCIVHVSNLSNRVYLCYSSYLNSSFATLRLSLSSFLSLSLSLSLPLSLSSLSLSPSLSLSLGWCSSKEISRYGIVGSHGEDS